MKEIILRQLGLLTLFLFDELKAILLYYLIVLNLGHLSKILFDWLLEVAIEYFLVYFDLIKLLIKYMAILLNNSLKIDQQGHNLQSLLGLFYAC